jgi:hypothetical protein
LGSLDVSKSLERFSTPRRHTFRCNSESYAILLVLFVWLAFGGKSYGCGTILNRGKVQGFSKVEGEKDESIL